MEVFQTPEKGFCFGVKRSIDIALETVKSGCLPVYTYGPLIHNPQVIKQLEAQGVIPIESFDGLPPGKLILRSHGVSPDVIKMAEMLGFTVIDAVCPFVKRAQDYAKKLYIEGYKVIIVGERSHPEVQGILGHTNMSAEVINHSYFGDFPGFKRVGVVAQTTLSPQRFVDVVAKLLPKVEELVVYNTICKDVILRQRHTQELAMNVDLMIVVGGKNSANTRRLAELSEGEGCVTYHIETKDELECSWFKGKSKVGVTAGASTPNWIIEEVMEKIKKIEMD